MAMLRNTALLGVALYLSRYGPICGVGVFIAVFLSGWLLSFFYGVYLYPRILSRLRHLPGPKNGHVILGYGLDELGLPGGVLAKKWEDAYAGRDAEPRPSFMRYLGFFGEEKLVPLTPEAYREILTRGDDIEIPTGIKKGLAPLLGDGLVLAEGARHDFLKKLAGPSFTPSQQRALVPTMWTVALKLNEKIKALVGSGADAKADINMFEWTNRVTFDMIFTTAWGKGTLASTFNSLENTGGFYAVHDRNLPAEGFHGLDAILCYVLPLFVDWQILYKLPFATYQNQLKDREYMHKTYRELIAQRKEKGLEASSDGSYKDLLSVMLTNKDISEYDLIENMMNFTGAGYATNAAALIWAIYELAIHPDMQTRLREEIRSVLGSSKTPVTSTEMDAMKYLHCFVMENARMYPSISTSWRETKRTIDIQGTTIPAHTPIVIANYAINHSKAYWGEDADEFIPERWTAGRRKPGVEHNGGFQTYAVGPKSCIGKEYSLRAIKTVLIALVGTFEFNYDGPDPMENLVPGLTMRPRGGLTVEVKMASPW